MTDDSGETRERREKRDRRREKREDRGQMAVTRVTTVTGVTRVTRVSRATIVTIGADQESGVGWRVCGRERTVGYGIVGTVQRLAQYCTVCLYCFVEVAVER